jgi:hypothetical protein
MKHKRTCYNCNRIFETDYYYSFFCENCCFKEIDLKVRRRNKQPIAIASYSGYVGYFKWILKQPNWVKLLNSPEAKEFTHSKF